MASDFVFINQWISFLLDSVFASIDVMLTPLIVFDVSTRLSLKPQSNKSRVCLRKAILELDIVHCVNIQKLPQFYPADLYQTIT